MTIYVELAVIENFLVSFILLSLSAKILRIKFSVVNNIIASLTGAIFAVILPVFKLPKFLDFAVKVILCFALTKIAFFHHAKKKKLLHASLTFLGVTFALGGLIYAIYAVFDIKEDAYSLFSLSILIPLIISAFCMYLYYILLVKLLKVLSKRIHVSKYIYSIKVSVAGKMEIFSGFYDSGNRLTDRESGLPVSIISIKMFSKLCPNVSIADVLLERETGLKNAHFVSYEVVGARKKILVFEPDEFLISSGDQNWSFQKCLVGVALKNFNDTIEYDMLLNGGISMEGV